MARYRTWRVSCSASRPAAPMSASVISSANANIHSHLGRPNDPNHQPRHHQRHDQQSYFYRQQRGAHFLCPSQGEPDPLQRHDLGWERRQRRRDCEPGNLGGLQCCVWRELGRRGGRRKRNGRRRAERQRVQRHGRNPRPPGAPIYSTGTLTILNSIFTNNSATGGAGGNGGQGEVNGFFSGNGGDGGSGGAGYGGAIYCTGASNYIATTGFENNTCTGGVGGSPWQFSAQPNCPWNQTGNGGVGAAGFGGAIFSAGNITVNDCFIYANTHHSRWLGRCAVF